MCGICLGVTLPLTPPCVGIHISNLKSHISQRWLQAEKGGSNCLYRSGAANLTSETSSGKGKRSFDFTFVMASLTAGHLQPHPTRTFDLLDTNPLGPDAIADHNEMLTTCPTNNNTYHPRAKSGSRTGRRKKSDLLPGQRTLDEYWKS
jgi:hypothetical protein